ncbi:MAG: PorP/SprF family type IX secretion system membrane protein [Thermonemataceae bacterium]
MSFTYLTYRFLLLFTILPILVGSSLLQAQNIRFSQYHYTPTLTNPALVTAKSEMSALFNFRQQRITTGQSYTTPMISFLYPFINKQKKNRWGGSGLSIANETTGPNGFFNTTHILAGLGYNLPLAEGIYVGFGLQGGYVQRSINTDNITTEELYLNGFDASLGVGEPLSSYRDGFPLINSGLLFYKEDQEQQIPFQLGVSLYNMNRPNVSFFGEVDRIPMSVLLTGEARVYQNELISIHPTFRWWQRTEVDQLNVGTSVRYKLNAMNNTRFLREGHIGANLWYNFNRVAIIGVQIEQPDYVFAFSYDFAAASNIPVRETNNAFEFTLGWRRIFDTRRRRKKRIFDGNLPISNKIFIQETPEEEIPKPENNRIEQTKGTTVIIRKPIEVIAPKETLALSASEKALLQTIISFDLQSIILSESTKAHLDEVATLLEQYPVLLYKITGYRQLSEPQNICTERVNVVRVYLIRKGIDGERIITDIAPKAEASPIVKPTLLR